jgi:hypothetical protein
MKAFGLDEMLAFYLKCYPLERDDEDTVKIGPVIALHREPTINSIFS